MAGNQLYPLYRQLLFQWGTGIGTPTRPTGTLKVALVSAAYTYDAAHDFQNDLGSSVIVSKAILNPQVSIGAVLDGDDLTFLALNNSGTPGVALVFFMDTGTTSTSRLIAFFDSGVSGLPVVSSGGNVNIAWNSSGIMAL